VSETRLQLAERIVAETLASLPDALRERAQRTPVLLTDRPDEEIAAEFGDDLLGLFDGETTDWDDVPAVSRIYLFLEPIAAYAAEEGTGFAEEVERTYLHELGHLFGWGEDDLAERDLD